jgi:hypothetical protein
MWCWRRSGGFLMRRSPRQHVETKMSRHRKLNCRTVSQKSVEKISFAAKAIAAINPLPVGLRTKRALLFSEGYRLLSRLEPSSLLRPSRSRSAGAHGRSRDATGPFIAAQRHIPDRTAPGPDRRHRCREPAGRWRLSYISIGNWLPVNELKARDGSLPAESFQLHLGQVRVASRGPLSCVRVSRSSSPTNGVTV